MAITPTNVRSLGIRWRWLALGSLPALVVVVLWWADPSPPPPGAHPSLTPDRPGAVLVTQVVTAALASLVLWCRVVLVGRRSSTSSRAHRGVAATWAVWALTSAVLAASLAAPAVLPGGRAAWWWAPDAGVLVIGLGVALSAHLAVRRRRGAPSLRRALLDGLLVWVVLGLLVGWPPLVPAPGASDADRLGAALVVPQAPLATTGLVMAVMVLAGVGLTAGSVVLSAALVAFALSGALRHVTVLDPSAWSGVGSAAALALALGWLAAAGLQPLPGRVRPPQPWQGLVLGVLVPQLVLVVALLAVAVRGLVDDGGHPPVALVVGVVVTALVRHLAAMRDDAGRYRDLLLGREELKRLGMTDHLTGVADRQAFTTALDRALRLGGGHDVVVARLDIDGFAAVNDRCGNAAGDAVLVAVADRLCSAVRGTDVVARLGGDEFAVLFVVPPPASPGASPAASPVVFPAGGPGMGVPAAITRRLRMAFSVPVEVDPGAIGSTDPRLVAECVEGLGVSTGVVAVSELRVPGEVPGEVAAVDGDALLHAAGVLVRRAKLSRTPAPQLPTPQLPAPQPPIPQLPAPRLPASSNTRTMFEWQEEWGARDSAPPG